MRRQIYLIVFYGSVKTRIHISLRYCLMYALTIPNRYPVGANIFLSSGGSLIKLGDFGSSIKLKDPMHTMHGEISNIRGTVGE